MRTVVALLAVAATGLATACSPGDSPGDHADPIDAMPGRPPQCNVPSPLCGLAPTCGNNQIDTCFMQLMPGHCYYQPSQEACDGSAVKSCTELGYFGGTTSCSPYCRDITTTQCDACAPGNLACEAFAPFATMGIAVSGSRVALASPSSIAIFDGITPLTRTTVSDAHAIAAVPGGWLVAMDYPSRLAVLDAGGTLGTAHPLPAGAQFTQLASGPADRVLVAWQQQVVTTWHVFIAIADANGNIVIPATDLFAVSADTYMSVTSDGTSFFVGANGRLARVSPDGASSVATGFPAVTNTMTIADIASVTWSGTTGWYICHGLVQRFDANGATVGGSFALPGGGVYVGYLADGDELLALRQIVPSAPFTSSARFVVLHLSQTGAVGASKDVGAMENGYGVYLARLGTDLFVAWSRTQALQVALVAP